MLFGSPINFVRLHRRGQLFLATRRLDIGVAVATRCKMVCTHHGAPVSVNNLGQNNIGQIPINLLTYSTCAVHLVYVLVILTLRSAQRECGL
jgi:hypothetical protein